jgi:hypothetical protein
MEYRNKVMKRERERESAGEESRGNILEKIAIKFKTCTVT